MSDQPTDEATYLAWAIRSWDAEVENARRLATRTNVVLTVALAAAAAGTKILGDTLPRHAPGWLAFDLLVGAALGLVFIFYAFVRVLIRPQRPNRRPQSASYHLLPPEDIGEVGSTLSRPVPAQRRAFLAATAAAYELHVRNAEENKRLGVGQQWLLIGAGLTLLCGALYTWSVPSAPRIQAGIGASAEE